LGLHGAQQRDDASCDQHSDQNQPPCLHLILTPFLEFRTSNELIVSILSVYKKVNTLRSEPKLHREKNLRYLVAMRIFAQLT
jgi:hypothetical protein